MAVRSKFLRARTIRWDGINKVYWISLSQGEDLVLTERQYAALCAAGPVLKNARHIDLFDPEA